MKSKDHKILIDQKEKKNNPFKIPEGYLDSLNEKVWDKIRKDEEHKWNNKKGKIRRIIYNQLFLAACLIGLAIVIYSGIHLILGRNTSNDVLSGNYIAQSIEAEIGNYDENILFDMIESPGTFYFSDNDMDEIIIEYLIHNNIDTELLFNEL